MRRIGIVVCVLLMVALAGLPAGVQEQVDDDRLYLAGMFSEANYPKAEHERFSQGRI